MGIYQVVNKHMNVILQTYYFVHSHEEIGNRSPILDCFKRLKNQIEKKTNCEKLQVE